MHTFSQHMQSFPSELGAYILFCCLRESNAVELVHNSDCIWSNQSTEYRTPRIILYAAVIIMRLCIRFIDVRLKVRNPTVWDLLPRFGWTAVNDLSLPRGELHQSPPPKNKQPLRSFEGHAGSGLDASMCVLLLHNSWLHAISTQMDMFPWPITSGLMHPSSCFILPSSAQLATAGIHQGFYVFFGLLNPKYRQKGETRSHTNTHTLRPDREVNNAVVILLWIIATGSSSDHHLPGVSVSSEMWQRMMC